MNISQSVFSPLFDNIIVYLVLILSILGIILIFIHRWKENSKSNFDKKNSRQKLISKNEKIRKENLNINQNGSFNLDLKLQAYERLTIFLSRIDPWRLLTLVNISEKNIKKIENDLLRIIISEFEYNLSQQVYVSDDLWELIESSKNKTLELVLAVKSNLKANANGNDFYNTLEEILKKQTVTPSKITLNYLKKEVRNL
tara:strand:+ start:48 stop:644 length:597 start_codon:yes stop_codon:yes gene_type:complete